MGIGYETLLFLDIFAHTLYHLTSSGSLSPKYLQVIKIELVKSCLIIGDFGSNVTSERCPLFINIPTDVIHFVVLLR